MNQNLKCTCCNKLLISTGVYSYRCDDCPLFGTNISFNKYDSNISVSYNVYLEKDNIYYHLHSYNGDKYNRTNVNLVPKDTDISANYDPSINYKKLVALEKGFPIYKSLPLKDQSNKILDLLLRMALFI